jgi:transposase
MDTAAEGLLTRDEMESRRLLAAQDLQRGLSQSAIAKKFGVSRTSASRWMRSFHRNGSDSLRKRRPTGRPSRLTSGQLEAVAEVYREGARAAGFVDDRWTTARFAEVVYARFGIKYDSDHMGRIINRLGLRDKAAAVPFAPALTMPAHVSAPEFAAQDEPAAASSAA